MSSPARRLGSTSGPMDLQKLESELLRLPFVVRQHLAYTLLDSVDEDDQGEIGPHRQAMETARGEEEEGIDTAEVIARLRTHRDGDVEAAWAEEAHRRWEAYLRGEEEMLDFDEVMAELKASLPQ